MCEGRIITNLVERYHPFEEFVADPHPLHLVPMSSSSHHLLEIPRLSCQIVGIVRIQSGSVPRVRVRCSMFARPRHSSIIVRQSTMPSDIIPRHNSRPTSQTRNIQIYPDIQIWPSIDVNRLMHPFHPSYHAALVLGASRRDMRGSNRR